MLPERPPVPAPPVPAPSSSPVPLLVPSGSPEPLLAPSGSPVPPLVPSSSPLPPLAPSGSPSSPLALSSLALPERLRESALPERSRELALTERPTEPAPPEWPLEGNLPKKCFWGGHIPLVCVAGPRTKATELPDLPWPPEKNRPWPPVAPDPPCPPVLILSRRGHRSPRPALEASPVSLPCFSLQGTHPPSPVFLLRRGTRHPGGGGNVTNLSVLHPSQSQRTPAPDFT